MDILMIMKEIMGCYIKQQCPLYVTIQYYLILWVVIKIIFLD